MNNIFKKLFSKKETESVPAVPASQYGDWRIDLIHREAEHMVNGFGLELRWIKPLEAELYFENRLACRIYFRKDISDYQSVVGLVPVKGQVAESIMDKYVRDGWRLSRDSISWSYLDVWHICHFAQQPEKYTPLWQLI